MMVERNFNIPKFQYITAIYCSSLYYKLYFKHLQLIPFLLLTAHVHEHCLAKNKTSEILGKKMFKFFTISDERHKIMTLPMMEPM